MDLSQRDLKAASLHQLRYLLQIRVEEVGLHIAVYQALPSLMKAIEGEVDWLVNPLNVMRYL